jgi:hypothetical protein
MVGIGVSFEYGRGRINERKQLRNKCPREFLKSLSLKGRREEFFTSC